MIKKQLDGPINQKALIAYSHVNPRYAAALKLAVKVFEMDKRPFTGLKFVSHAMTVSSLLLEVKADATVLIAAALQDVLAKPAVTEDSLNQVYGPDCVALVKSVQVGSDVVAFVATLAQAEPGTHTLLAASLLDEVCSIPKKSIQTPTAREILERAVAIAPALTKAHPELSRRLSVIVKHTSLRVLA